MESHGHFKCQAINLYHRTKTFILCVIILYIINIKIMLLICRASLEISFCLKDKGEVELEEGGNS